jgi:hypothetical protein
LAPSVENILLVLMRSTAAVVAGVAAVALAACGGSGSGLSLDPVASAASKAMSSSGEKVEMRALLFTGSGRHWWGSMQGGGVMTSKAADLTILVSPIQGPSFTLHEIYVIQASGPVVYFSSPPLSRRLPQGKPWLRVDVAKILKRDFGAEISKLPQTNDPSEFLRLLRARGLHPVKRGDETIDGRKTTRYHAEVGVEQAIEKTGVSKAGARLLRQQLTSMTIPVDAWVDEDGYLPPGTRDAGDASLDDEADDDAVGLRPRRLDRAAAGRHDRRRVGIRRLTTGREMKKPRLSGAFLRGCGARIRT